MFTGILYLQNNMENICLSENPIEIQFSLLSHTVLRVYLYAQFVDK